MTRSRLQALQGAALFGAIREETIAFVLERARIVEVAAGDYYFRQGDSGHDAYLLEAGETAVLKEWGGEPHRLSGLTAGDCFGEVALLDFGPRSSSIRAEVDCRAIEISALNLRALAKWDTEQFALIYMNLGRELSRRLREADERLFRLRVDHAQSVEDYSFSASSL